MKVMSFSVEDALYDSFRAEVDYNGMKVAALFRIFMFTYAAKKLEISGGLLRAAGSADQTTFQELRKPGRPPAKPVERHTEPAPLISDPAEGANFFRSGGDPAKRKLGSYMYVMISQDRIHLEAGEPMAMDTSDGKGGTFRDFCDKYYPVWRRETCSTVSHFFDYGMEMYLIAMYNKFIEDNSLKGFKYDQDALWGDMVTLAGELAVKYEKELSDMEPYTG